ncbi:DUF2314 domain-containing protein [Sphingomonas sp. ERG5]|uniref:DUF2314 domain-containing protein n=1 Tax=Sphingomonas sp. ERG5 TaxID=1381597 RepID=UPI00054BFA54|nr:DUF2314 domain-containing protein [Sphingomonas sp. ERG5]
MANMFAMMLGLALVAGCSDPVRQAEAQQAGAQDAKDEVVKVAPDDPAMEAAKREGRRTLSEFWRHQAKPARDETMFSLKYDLLPGPAVEYVWASVVKRDAQGIVGELGNTPEAPGYTLGQRVRIDEGDIIDWQYRKGSRMEGHYTTRVLLDRMPPAEAQEYRAALGW